MSIKTINAIRIIWTAPAGWTDPGTYPNGAWNTTATVGGVTTTTGLEIRLSEDDISNYATLIAQKGIQQLSGSADGRRGADKGNYDGLDVAMVNAESLMQGLTAIGVNLQGCPVELHEFSGPVGSYGDTVIFTGICDDVAWSATGLTLKCKNSRLRRNAAAWTMIENGDYTDVSKLIQDVEAGTLQVTYPYALDDDTGKIVPLTFGSMSFDGTVGVPAKMVRTAGVVAPLVVNGGGANTGGLTTVLSYTDSSGNPKAMSAAPSAGDIQYRYVYGAAPVFADMQDFPVYGPQTVSTNAVAESLLTLTGSNDSASGIEAALAAFLGRAINVGDTFSASADPTHYLAGIKGQPFALTDVYQVTNAATPTYSYLGNSPVTTYYLKIGDVDSAGNPGYWQKGVYSAGAWSWTIYATAGPIPLTLLSGLYLTVIDGTNAQNEGALITSAAFDPSGAFAGFGGYSTTDAGVIAITIANNNYFTGDDNASVQLQGLTYGNVNPSTPAAGSNWVQIQTIYQDYTADTWPLAGAE
jgi:hypothetical protein